MGNVLWTLWFVLVLAAVIASGPVATALAIGGGVQVWAACVVGSTSFLVAVGLLFVSGMK